MRELVDVVEVDQTDGAAVAAAAAAITAVTGREVTPIEISDEQFTDALREAGMGSAEIEGLVGIGQGIRAGFTPEDPRTARTTTPRRWRPGCRTTGPCSAWPALDGGSGGR